MQSIQPDIEAAVKAFVLQPGIQQNLDRLRHCLPVGADILIAGGAIRNIVMASILGNGPKTCDIDLFISGVPGEYPLENCLAGQNFHRTELGGLRWLPDEAKYVFDICLLPNFVMIAKYHLAPTVSNFLATIDLTVNAACYDIGRHQLDERGCVRAIKNRVIEFNTGCMLNKLLLAYRVLLIRHKTGFFLSDHVYSFVKDQIDLDTLNRLKDLLDAKQGATVAKKILCDYNRIINFRNHTEPAGDKPRRCINNTVRFV